MENVITEPTNKPVGRKWRRLLRYLFLVCISVVIGTGLIGAALYFFQAKLIYFPQPYWKYYERLMPPGTVEMKYLSPQGNQTAFYIPPRKPANAQAIPERIWVLFGGNGSLALHWGGIVNASRDDKAGFLLVEYPGYGNCAGSPNPVSLQQNAEGAFSALAAQLKTTTGMLESDLNILGHSLGTAAALQFAVNHPVKRIVLLAPFTSLLDMAKEQFGGFAAPLLRHRFDNRARLAELYGRSPRPRVVIVHGSVDEVIPQRMGRELAREFESMAEFHGIREGSHMDAVDEAVDWLRPF
jgi:uncharacterized protein